MRRFLLALLYSGTLLGCSTEKTSVSKRPASTLKGVVTPGHALVDPTTLELLDSLGDRPAFVGVLHPREWPQALAFVQGFDAVLPPKLRTLLGKTSTLKEVLHATLGVVPTVAAVLKSWDDTRPIVAGLFEAVADGPPGASDVLIPAGVIVGRGPSVPMTHGKAIGFRHTLLVPALAPNKLVSALAALLDGVATKTDGFWRVRLPWRGGVAVALTSSHSHTRITIIDGIDRGTRSPAVKVRLSQALGARPHLSPAYTSLAEPGAIARLLVRPWHLPAVYVAQGLRQMHDAIEGPNIPNGLHGRLFAAGTRLVVASAAMMRSSRPQFRDHAAAIKLSKGGLVVYGVSTVTPDGEKILAARASGAIQTLPLKKPALLTVTSTLNPSVIASDAHPWPENRGTDAKPRPRALARALSECGHGCWVYGFLSAPFGLAKAAFDVGVPEVVAVAKSAPVAYRLSAIVSPQRRLNFAIAFTLRPGDDAQELAALLTAKKLVIHRVTHEGQRFLLVGNGLDPRDVFDVSRTENAPAVIRVVVDPKAFGPKLPKDLRPLEKLGVPMHPLTVNASFNREQKAGFWTLSVATHGVAPSAPVQGPYTPLSAVALRPAAPNERCVDQALTQLQQSLSMISMLSEGSSQQLSQTADNLETSNRCLRQRAETAPVATRVERILAGVVSAIGADSLEPSPFQALAKRLCQMGRDPWTCGRSRAISTLILIDLPTVVLHCDGTDQLRGGTLKMSTSGLYAGTKKLSLTGLASYLARDKQPQYVRGDRRPAFNLAVDSEVQDTKVANFISNHPSARISLVVKTRDGVRAFTIERMGPTKGASGARARGTESTGAPKRPESFAHSLIPKSPEFRLDLNAGRATVTVLSTGKVLYSGAAADGEAIAKAMPEAHGPIAVVVGKPSPWRSTAHALGALCRNLQLFSSEHAPTPFVPVEQRSPDTSRKVRGTAKARPKRTRTMISRVMRRRRGAIKRCYERELKKDPSLGGRVNIRFAIAPSGRVKQAIALKNTIASTAVGECIVDHIKRLRFPPGKTQVVITMPFVFTTGK